MSVKLHPVLLVLALIYLSVPAAAQSFGPQGHSCGADEARSLRHLTDPASQLLENKLERQWANHVHSPRRSMPPPYTLPIVFHIVHDNGPENISDADVLQSLEYTNQAFANTDYYDQGTGVTTGVQFCLARRTPDNQPTTGITRIMSPEYTDLEATAEDRDMKDLLRWEPRDYINVYVVKEICGLGLGCGVAGYAYYPSAHGGRVDGVVVEARWLAGNEASASVLVHELGHYLGIRHTFDGGCTNDDCTTDGDRVCDTPPDQSKAAVPCSGSVNSCTTDTDSGFATDQNDMFINYMDYGYWGCYSAFTQGQADRMHFFLDGIRRSLLESPGCLDPCPAVVTADFTGGGVTVEAGTTVSFTNTSTNGTTYAWRVNGSTFATTTDASFQFSNDGFYEVTLFAAGNPPLCQPDSMVQTVRVVCSLTAGFDLGGPTTVGEERTFTNTSNLATDYRWRVDGALVSTNTDLTYAFPGIGLYEVCLQAGNDFCRKTVCRNIYAAPPPDSTTTGNPDCSASFAFAYRSLFSDITDGQFTASVPDGGGGYYAALTLNRQPVVVHLAPDGNLLWEIMLFPNGNDGIIRELIFDQDGQLAGTGQTMTGQAGTQSTSGNFVFRIDPENGILLWGRQYLNQGPALLLNTIIHPRAGEPYALFGTLRGNNPGGNGSGGVLLRLDPTTGDVAGGNATLFPGSSIASFERTIYDDASQQFRAVGYSPTNASAGGGILLTTLSLAGAIVRTESIDDSFVTNGTLDIAGNENGFAVLANTPAGTITNAPFRLYRFTADGAPSGAADYYGPTNANVLDLAANEQGYATMTAYDGGAPVLTQLDPAGEVVWVRTLFVTPEYDAPAQILTPEPAGGIVLGTEAIFNVFELLPCLIKVRPDGTIDGDCVVNEETFLERDDIDFGLNDWQAFAAPLSLTEEEFFWEPAGLEFAGGDCREPCEEEEAPGCEEPFFLAYDEGDAVTRGGFTAVVTNGDTKYVGGSINDRHAYIASLNPDGSINWQHYLGEPDDDFESPQAVFDLRIDDEGMLVGITGNARGETSGRRAGIFKIAPETGAFLWHQTLSGTTTGEGLSFHNVFTPTGSPDYFVSGTSFQGDVRGAILRFDRNTGALQNGEGRTYAANLETGFPDAVMDPASGVLYTVGDRTNTLGIATVVITAIDLTTDDVIWSRTYHRNAPVETDLKAASIALLGNKVYVLATEGEGLFSTFYLIDTELTDPVSGVYRYDAPAGSYRFGELASRENELVLVAGQSDFHTLVVIGEGDGEVARAERIEGVGLLEPGTNKLEVRSDRITVAGQRSFAGAVLYGEGTGDRFTDCTPNVTPTDYSRTFQTFTYDDLNQNQIELSVIDASPLAGSNRPGNLFQSFDSCPADCETPDEICDNQIDDDGDGFVDCDDPDLASDCCCLDDPQRLFGTDTVRCGGVTISAPPLENLRFLFTDQNGATSDTLSEFPAQLLSEPGTYIITYIDTCLRTASDSITLHPRPRPTLELGPDTTLCSNAVIPLLAQPGFETYEWVDGSQTRSFTAYDAGTYWVTATDSCGEQQSDTVRVRIDPVTAIDLGADTIICPGDTITFSLNGFTDYQWSQSSFIDCTDCPAVRFAPTTDTLLLVAATEGPGCFSSDSIRVRVASLEGLNREADLCPNDTLLLGNQAITQAGTFLDTVAVGNCFRVDTIQVRGLTDTTLTDTLTICSGDSTLVFGTFESEAGTYSRQLPRANGCDSTTIVQLIVRPGIMTTEAIQICRGDSALIFGQFETEPGLFQREFTGSGGCDSLHQITLEVDGALLETEVFSNNCQGGAAGAGEVRITAGNGPFDILWSNGAATNQLSGLAAGVYVVSVTDAEGCVVTDSLEIMNRVPPTVTLNAQPETCPGENDGSLTLAGDLNGLLFSLDDSLYAARSFFPDLAPGNYRVYVQDTLGCGQSYPFSIGAADGFFVDLPPRFVIAFGDSLTLVPLTNVPNPRELVWTTEGTLLCAACPTLTLRPETTTTINVGLLDTTDCPVITETTVRVERDNLFYVPNAFSPNDDGVNDLFRVFPGPAVAEVLRLAVYDRWGGEVFLRKNVDPTSELDAWDGTRPGGRDPGVGVYVYELQVRLFNGEIIRTAGEVLLIR